MTGEGRRATITIGRLAAAAGVTVKAVRHYHRRGLLDEPERDASGYRRYDAAHVVRLVEIRTLAAAGVPLARVGELLDAGPEVLAAAVAEIDEVLQGRVAELERTRARLAGLRRDDGLYTSPEVAELLDLLREIGAGPRTVRAERDGWIVLHAVDPDRAAAVVADKREMLRDPAFRELYLAHDAAVDWAPDDPRLAELAERSRRWLDARRTSVAGAPDPAVAPLLAGAGPPSPAWQRLATLADPPREPPDPAR